MHADMQEKGTCCNELIEKTYSALTDDRLKLLLASVQQTNVNLCVREAVQM